MFHSVIAFTVHTMHKKTISRIYLKPFIFHKIRQSIDTVGIEENPPL